MKGVNCGQAAACTVLRQFVRLSYKKINYAVSVGRLPARSTHPLLFYKVRVSKSGNLYQNFPKLINYFPFYQNAQAIVIFISLGLGLLWAPAIIVTRILSIITIFDDGVAAHSASPFTKFRKTARPAYQKRTLATPRQKFKLLVKSSL